MHRINQKKLRRVQQGSALILVVAGIMTVVGLGFFALRFCRILASHQEQKTAIEAAALAAAHDLSKIVIDDPNLGFVSLSDYAPVGKATMARDNYFLSAQSINSVLGTVRLDMIIADRLNDELMKKLALEDYKNAIAAKDDLVRALRQSIDMGTPFTDIDGNLVDPLADAKTAYEANVIRIVGPKNRLRAGSLKLSLGCVQNLTSNLPIPQPDTYASVSSNEQDNGFYKSCTNVKYDQQDFVFAPVSDSVTLVDFKQFQPNIQTLPYVIPSIVKCEGDEEYNETDQFGKPSQMIVHAVACAQPACLIDSRPAPGALTIQVVGPSVPELKTLFDVFTSPMFANSPTDLLQTPSTGDTPSASLSDLKVAQFDDSHPKVGSIMRLALYNWIKRAGPALNIASLMTAMQNPLTIISGQMFMLEKDQTGNIVVPPQAVQNGVLPVSQNQLLAVSGGAVNSSNHSVYDLILKDYVYQSGRSKGGLHAGEPMPLENLAAPPTVTKNPGLRPTTAVNFPFGPASGAVRQTYQKPASAVDITFRAR